MLLVHQKNDDSNHLLNLSEKMLFLFCFLAVFSDVGSRKSEIFDI